MDETGFAAFHNATSRQLWSYVYRASGNADLADDIVQEAYCRLLPRLSKEMDEIYAKRYLYRIATNLLRDRWREAKRAEIVGVEQSATAAHETGLAHDMSAVFRLLKPREQALLWLAYVEGANHREIASALELREKSVRVLLSRARNKLAQLLHRKGFRQ